MISLTTSSHYLSTVSSKNVFFLVELMCKEQYTASSSELLIPIGKQEIGIRFDMDSFKTIVTTLLVLGRYCLSSYLINLAMETYGKTILAWKIGVGQEYVIEVDRRWYTAIYVIASVMIFRVIMYVYSLLETCITTLLRPQPPNPPQPSLVHIHVPIENIGPSE